MYCGLKPETAPYDCDNLQTFPVNLNQHTFILLLLLRYALLGAFLAEDSRVAPLLLLRFAGKGVECFGLVTAESDKWGSGT